MSANEFYSSAPQGKRDPGSGPQTSNYNADANQNGQQLAGDGERGFLSTVAGGAAGAYAGGKLGGNHSTMGKIAGGLLGAFAANKLEDRFKQGHHQGYPSGGYSRGIEHGGPGGPPGHGAPGGHWGPGGPGGFGPGPQAPGGPGGPGGYGHGHGGPGNW